MAVTGKDLKAFYVMTSQQPKQLTYGDIQQIWVDPSTQTVEAHGGEIQMGSEYGGLSQQNLAEKVTALGKSLKEITQMLTSAETPNDPYRDALGRLVQQYSTGEPSIQK